MAVACRYRCCIQFGRAEGLRRSMLAMTETGDGYAHPELGAVRRGGRGWDGAMIDFLQRQARTGKAGSVKFPPAWG
jgi:hypothetical protein